MIVYSSNFLLRSCRSPRCCFARPSLEMKMLSISMLSSSRTDSCSQLHAAMATNLPYCFTQLALYCSSHLIEDTFLSATQKNFKIFYYNYIGPFSCFIFSVCSMFVSFSMVQFRFYGKLSHSDRICDIAC